MICDIIQLVLSLILLYGAVQMVRIVWTLWSATNPKND